MKYIPFFLLILFSTSLSAKKGLRLHVPYAVILDKKVSDVPEGFCRVQGAVFYQGALFSHGIVANYDMTRRTKVDSTGNYSFLIPITDSIIFFFAPGKEEIVINPYDFKNGHEVDINFYPTDNIEMIIVDKPVIYAYSQSNITASFRIDFKGDLQFTYPNYDKGWNVNINKKGLTDLTTNKTYPYLFWEGQMPTLAYQEENEIRCGTFLKTDSLVGYLETQLTHLGLNRAEQTDFITFWGPRMQNSPYVFMQFLVDDAYTENIAELKVSPKPDNMRRIYLLYTPYDEHVEMNLKEQQFNKFERNGFTVVEWGGSVIKNAHLNF